jgi:hypothetical protein
MGAESVAPALPIVATISATGPSLDMAASLDRIIARAAYD